MGALAGTSGAVATAGVVTGTAGAVAKWGCTGELDSGGGGHGWDGAGGAGLKRPVATDPAAPTILAITPRRPWPPTPPSRPPLYRATPQPPDPEPIFEQFKEFLGNLVVFIALVSKLRAYNRSQL